MTHLPPHPVQRRFKHRSSILHTPPALTHPGILLEYRTRPGATIVSSVTGRGSAWLERLVRDQEVAGSNPVAPTLRNLFAESEKRLPADVRRCGLMTPSFRSLRNPVSGERIMSNAAV